MKESKINSFIKFIGTVGNKSKEKESQASDDFLILKGKQQRKHHYNTLSLHEDSSKSHAIVLHKPNKCIVQKCSTDLITSQDSNIKHRYEDKQVLYEAYRLSLQKKKDQLQLGTNKLINKLTQIQQSQSFSKQLVFPIKRTKKIQQTKSNYAYQKIFSNRSMSICPQQSGKNLKTQKFHSNQKTEIFVKREEEYLREKKLDYKPIFRVKKVHLLDSYRTQTAPPIKQQFPEVSNIKKQRQSLGCKVKIKTEPVQAISKIVSFRDKKASRNRGTINTIERVGGWEYDQSQQMSRIFF